MVSFWPWKGDNSAESFEKTLSIVAKKISTATASNDRLRQRARKIKATWILYGGFSYLIAALILTLVTGWRNWNTVEWSVMVGAPLILIGGRILLTRYYNYRIASSQEHLDNLQKERQATIDKLKQATKYDTTQQILDKYGATPKSTQDIERKQEVAQRKQNSGRIVLPIPPTANIQRKPESLPNTSAPTESVAPSYPHAQPVFKSPPSRPQAGEEFAPNAYDGPPPSRFAPSAEFAKEYHWYDRLFDALLGEDESQAKNRLALICKQCRIVNGMAPPGIKTPEELGKWRCSGCGAWNGEDFEATRLIEEHRQDESAVVPEQIPCHDSTTSGARLSGAATGERNRGSNHKSDVH